MSDSSLAIGFFWSHTQVVRLPSALGVLDVSSPLLTTAESREPGLADTAVAEVVSLLGASTLME
jgi:hypothetical protein